MITFDQIALALIVQTFELYDRKLVAFALRDEDVTPDPKGTFYKAGPNNYEKIVGDGKIKHADPDKCVRVVTTADERIVAYCIKRAWTVHRMIEEAYARGPSGGRAPGGELARLLDPRT